MFFDPTADAKKVFESYKATDAKKFNCLITGPMGSGKTFLLRSVRKPLHIDSFDPGGTRGLRSEILNHPGSIIPNTKYESEDPKKPSMFLEWERDINALMATDYFTKLGSYCLDSTTMWQEAMMNSILGAANIAGKPPRFTHDYMPHRYAIRNWVKKLLDLPCDVYLTGHLELNKTQAGEFKYTFMTTGQGVILIPILFDEVYVMCVKEGGLKPSYSLQTQPSSMFDARSRLAEDGKLEMYEKPDMKHILKKAGYTIEDKPPLF